MTENVETVVRTGQAYSIASSEFLITYKDGTALSVWSPPWHDFSPEEEEKGAREYAEKEFLKRRNDDSSQED